MNYAACAIKPAAVTVKCPWCKQELEADADMLGESIQCPGCGNPLVLPASAEPDRQPVLDMSTTALIPNCEIVAHCGIVSEVVVLGSNAVADVKAAFSDLFGGKSNAYTKVFEKAREMVLDAISKKARALGADAIVGLRLDYETVKDTMMMVSATGTAVKLAE
jgi:uncharacterized protein YbjQ (UPF0145 family)/DNA-directed RNA polymerase subunit RPC12/RpoP